MALAPDGLSARCSIEQTCVLVTFSLRLLDGPNINVPLNREPQDRRAAQVR
jgi:hypothetical protein